MNKLSIILVFLTSWIANIKFDQTVFKLLDNLVKGDFIKSEETLKDLPQGNVEEDSKEQDKAPHVIMYNRQSQLY